MVDNLNFYIGGFLLAGFIFAILTLSSGETADLTGFMTATYKDTGQENTSQKDNTNNIVIFRSEDEINLGICLQEIEINVSEINESFNETNSTDSTNITKNITHETVRKIVISDDGFDNETTSETIILNIPRDFFKEYTGIDLILDLEDLDDKELKIIVNGEDKIKADSGDNYTGSKIIFIEKEKLLIGENSIVFMNPADNRCGLVIHEIDIRASLRNIKDFELEEQSLYIFEHDEEFSLIQCPQNETLSKNIKFNPENYSFEDYLGLELIVYAKWDIDINEVKVYNNNMLIGWLKPPEDNYQGIIKIFIPNDNLILDENSLKIENPVGGGCGVTIGSIRIKPKPRETPEEYRILFSNGNFQIGNCFWKGENKFLYSVDFSIERKDLKNITGIDVVLDLEHLYKDELEVIINAENLGYIKTKGHYTGKKIIYIPRKYLITGINTVLLRINPDMMERHCMNINNIKITLSNKNESNNNIIGVEQKRNIMYYTDKLSVEYCPDMETENYSKTIKFTIPFSVFKEYSGINIIAEKVTSLAIHEIMVNVNGIDLGWVSSPYNQYSGAKKIFIPDKYLTSGENSITFIRPTYAGRCGATFHKLEIVPANYGVSEYE